MKQQMMMFAIRWILNSFGLWIAVRVFGTGYSGAEIDAGVAVFVGRTNIFSCQCHPKTDCHNFGTSCNLIDARSVHYYCQRFMVWISLKLAPGLQMTFWHSVLTGLVLSLVNYVVSSVLELEYSNMRKEQ